MRRKIIGYAPYNIPIYENSYFFNSQNKYNKGRKGSKYENIIYGLKYQCVEFARRWVVHVFNVVFEDVNNADDIFQLSHAKNIETNKSVPFIHIKNNKNEFPKPNDIIIWKKCNLYKNTGHVAIVTKIISNSMVQIAEQNGETSNGIRNINPHNKNIIGWMRL